MRVSYKTYTYHDNEKIVDEDLGLWLSSWLGNQGIESQLTKLRELVILFTEDMLAKHPDRIGKVADILDAKGYEHEVIHDNSDEEHDGEDFSQD